MPPAIKRTQVHDSLNAAMVLMIPELDSDYALTPMQYRKWKKPEDTLDNGNFCFIASMENQGMKKDYIYAPQVPETKDEYVGYYHLLTHRKDNPLPTHVSSRKALPFGALVAACVDNGMPTFSKCGGHYTIEPFVVSPTIL